MSFITAGGPLLDDYLAGMPLGRVGTVDDIAEAVRFLAGPESSWITGVNLPDRRRPPPAQGRRLLAAVRVAHPGWPRRPCRTRPAAAVGRYLGHVDKRLPGRLVGLYVVGSTALGAYRPGRSDIDVVGVTDGRFDPDDLRRLRLVHLGAGAGAAARALAWAWPMFPGTVNAVFVAAEDLPRPVTTIVPVASHVGHEFHAGEGFDVNPVMWKVLVDRGVAVRGPEPGDLGLDPEPEALRAWNLANLDRYWAGYAARGPGGRRRRPCPPAAGRVPLGGRVGRARARPGCTAPSPPARSSPRRTPGRTPAPPSASAGTR